MFRRCIGDIFDEKKPICKSAFDDFFEPSKRTHMNAEIVIAFANDMVSNGCRVKVQECIPRRLHTSESKLAITFGRCNALTDFHQFVVCVAPEEAI